MKRVSTTSRTLVFVVGIGALALGVRAVHNHDTREVPFVRHPSGDARAYVQWAAAIADGDVLGSLPFYQAPLYPYVLGAGFAVFGAEVSTVRAMQACWGAAACVLVGLAARKWFGHRAGWVAGIMMCIYPPAFYFDGIVQKASLDGLLVAGLLFGLAHARFDSVARGVCWAVALGIGTGLTALTRENAFVWVPLLAAWVFMRGHAEPAAANRKSDPPLQPGVHSKSPAKHETMNGTKRLSGFALAGFLLGLAMVLVPVGIRNRAVSGEWSFSTFQAGPNFYIGNNREADGRYRPLVRGHETPDFERADATKLAQEALGRPLSAREVSDYWMSRALEDIRKAPGDWVRLLGLKCALTWNRYEIADLESPAVYAEFSRLLAGLDGIWHFGVLVPLAAIGAWHTRDRWRALWVVHALVLSMSLAVALFFVLGRYRFALVPLLVPFAAVGLLSLLDWLWALICRRTADAQPEHDRKKCDDSPHRSPSAADGSGAGRGFFGWPCLTWIALAAAVNWPIQDERRLNAVALTNLGSVLGAQGDLQGATHWLRKAVEGHPQSAEAHFNLAYALSLKGEHAEATVHYRAALALEPALMHVDFLLGQSLEALGDRESALRHYARAVELDPAHQEARAALQRLRGPG